MVWRVLAMVYNTAKRPNSILLYLLTMGLAKTGDSLSIFEDGRLNPEMYKIQNLQSGTYLDIHERSREVCCHSVKNLEQGKGLVRLYLPSMVRVSES